MLANAPPLYDPKFSIHVSSRNRRDERVQRSIKVGRRSLGRQSENDDSPELRRHKTQAVGESQVERNEAAILVPTHSCKPISSEAD